MMAQEFRVKAENGELPIDGHDLVLRIAYIYTVEYMFDDGVFDTVHKLHTRGWSFGQGDLKFNRYAS